MVTQLGFGPVAPVPLFRFGRPARRHVLCTNRVPPTIDLLPHGSFRQPPRRPVVPLSAKMMLAAVVVAAIGVSILVAALAIWVVSMVLPVVLIAAAGAWCIYKFQRWQLFRSQAGALRPRQSGGFGQ